MHWIHVNAPRLRPPLGQISRCHAEEKGRAHSISTSRHKSGTSPRQTLKDVLGTLQKEGLSTSYHVFQITVWRARKYKGPTAAHDWEKVNLSSPQEPLQQSEPLPRSVCKSKTVGREPTWISLARNE
jgi:hypothetical protein